MLTCAMFLLLRSSCHGSHILWERSRSYHSSSGDTQLVMFRSGTVTVFIALMQVRPPSSDSSGDPALDEPQQFSQSESAGCTPACVVDAFCTISRLLHRIPRRKIRRKSLHSMIFIDLCVLLFLIPTNPSNLSLLRHRCNPDL